MKKQAKPKILAIVGQTASGKSALAVSLAKKFNGEVISADSRQVYKGLNLGTGKITKKEMLGIPHHLLDVEDPKKRFTVSVFKEMADAAISEIISRGKLPILCGGTGFYIEAVVKNVLLPDVPVNEKLRKLLQKKSAAQLFSMLKKIQPERAQAIGEQNKVRLIRALEIIDSLGKIPDLKTEPKYKVLSIGLKTDKEILKQKINTRLLSRIKSGMINEAKKLHKQGLSWKRMEELGLEYRSLAHYLQNKISKEEMIEKLNLEINQYARRQAQWFKRDKNIKWLKANETKKIDAAVAKFLK